MGRSKELLTEPELEVLRAVARYPTVSAAAMALHRSPNTVKTHLNNIRRKSGQVSTGQLVAWGVATGLLDPTSLGSHLELATIPVGSEPHPASTSETSFSVGAG